jgi:hypothetical protein
MTRIRITIEYDLDDPAQTLEKEKEDWYAGDITFEDLASLADDPDLGVDKKITFEQI